MNGLRNINYLISIIFLVCYSYQYVYILIGLFIKPKKKQLTIYKNRYAILICCRNEEKVIGELIDSIKNQSYDQKLIDIFVMADNCSDNTYGIASQKGAIVYKRYNKTQIGKGYALRELRKHINRDYGDKYDGYFVFDADNILSKDYIERMNETFNEGFNIVTSYRNSKNYGDNWISAGYGLWFIRESRFLNYPRYLINSSACVGGTGFLFSSKVAEEIVDWPFFMLTEDIEFSINQVCKNRKIGYCHKAVFYDEQPTSFKQSYYQRLRWSKGYLQVLNGYFFKLVKGIFKGSFSCFDLLMNIFPAFILSFVGITMNLSDLVASLYTRTDSLGSILSMFDLFKNMYLVLFVVGLITTITEWKSIHTSSINKVMYCFTFPIFMMTFIPISIIAIFKNVSWQPINHNVSINQCNFLK